MQVQLFLGPGTGNREQSCTLPRSWLETWVYSDRGQIRQVCPSVRWDTDRDRRNCFPKYLYFWSLYLSKSKQKASKAPDMWAPMPTPHLPDTN